MTKVTMTFDRVLVEKSIIEQTAHRINDFKVCYALKKSKTALEREAKIINELAEELRDKHQLVKDGEKQYDKLPDGTQLVIFKDKAAYLKERRELMEQTITVDLHTLTFPSIEAAEKVFDGAMKAILLELLDTVVYIDENLESEYITKPTKTK